MKNNINISNYIKNNEEKDIIVYLDEFLKNIELQKNKISRARSTSYNIYNEFLFTIYYYYIKFKDKSNDDIVNLIFPRFILFFNRIKYKLKKDKKSYDIFNDLEKKIIEYLKNDRKNIKEVIERLKQIFELIGIINYLYLDPNNKNA